MEIRLRFSDFISHWSLVIGHWGNADLLSVLRSSGAAEVVSDYKVQTLTAYRNLRGSLSRVLGTVLCGFGFGIIDAQT